MPDDRDSQLDRALARHLRHASPNVFCPDAEVLAAYHERTLPLEEMTRWKEHIAGCRNCQETLALVEETEAVVNPAQDRHAELVSEGFTVPAAAPMAMPKGVSLPESARSTAKTEIKAEPAIALSVRRPLRWLLPVGALAAALLVWVGIREGKRTELSPRIEVAENREPAPQSPPMAGSQAIEPVPQPEPPKTKASAKPAQNGASGGDSVADAIVSKQWQDSNETATKELDERQKQLDAAMAQRELSNNLAASSGAIAEKVPHPPRAAARPPAPGISSTASGVTSEFRNEQKKRDALAKDEIISATQPASSPNAYLLQKMSSGDPAMILAPGNQQAWFVGKAGTLLHTSDAGQTWRIQNSGVNVDLITGSSPDSAVAWVIGKSGTILLTVDGGDHWKKLASPVAGDWGGIRADDAQHATVWNAAHDKTFATTDAGANWVPVANP